MKNLEFINERMISLRISLKGYDVVVFGIYALPEEKKRSKWGVV